MSDIDKKFAEWEARNRAAIEKEALEPKPFVEPPVDDTKPTPEYVEETASEVQADPDVRHDFDLADLDKLDPSVLALALLKSLARGAPEGEVKAFLEKEGFQTLLDIRWIARVSDSGGKVAIFGPDNKELPAQEMLGFFLHVLTVMASFDGVHPRFQQGCKKLIALDAEIRAAYVRQLGAQAPVVKKLS